MEDARDARILLVERESLDLLFGEGIFRGRRSAPPDLVVIDTALRDVDGYAVLRRLRNDWRLRRVPVVFLCASPIEGERAMSGPDRPNAYLVKPVGRDAFAEIVRQVRNWSLRLDLPEDAAYRVLRWPCEFAAARA
jgi:CheY-like chemotaxis protein